jgi:hypothetical protein
VTHVLQEKNAKQSFYVEERRENAKASFFKKSNVVV